MGAMHATHWRQLGYLPASEAARALEVPVMTLHRWVDRYKLPQERHGRYRFVRVRELIAHMRSVVTEKKIADAFADALRLALKQGDKARVG